MGDMVEGEEVSWGLCSGELSSARKEAESAGKLWKVREETKRLIRLVPFFRKLVPLLLGRKKRKQNRKGKNFLFSLSLFFFLLFLSHTASIRYCTFFGLC